MPRCPHPMLSLRVLKLLVYQQKNNINTHTRVAPQCGPSFRAAMQGWMCKGNGHCILSEIAHVGGQLGKTKTNDACSIFLIDFRIHLRNTAIWENNTHMHH